MEWLSILKDGFKYLLKWFFATIEEQREEKEEAKAQALETTESFVDQLERERRHEKRMDEIRAGVSDERASQLLSNGPTRKGRRPNASQARRGRGKK